MLTDILLDNFGRRIDYLRISVTDRCDFRCVYCMAEDMKFLPRQRVLGLDDLYLLAERFVTLGTRKIRLTGGEPLIRPGILGLCERIAILPGLNELCLTTNGSHLARLAYPLFATGLKRLNISMDSLRPTRFRQLTRTGELNQVLAGIDAALAAGFQQIKLNCVVMKGRNDDEILDLVTFAINHRIDISFIEEMPLGRIDEHSRVESFCSSAEVRNRIAERYTLIKSMETTNGPSRYWRLAEFPSTRIGFVSPHSENFCADCNRVRITAEGKLLLCLGNEASVDLKKILECSLGDNLQLDQAILGAMRKKPKNHDFQISDDVQVIRFMNMSGG